MNRRTLIRVGLLVVVTITAAVLLVAAGLGGVVPGLPVAVCAPFVVVSAVRERRARRMFDAELDAWLGRTGGHG